MKRSVVILTSIVLWIVLFGLFQLTNASHFFYWEQHQLFLPTNTYRPFLGIKDCIAEWITQWYYWRYAGPAILSTLIVLTFLLLHIFLSRTMTFTDDPIFSLRVRRILAYAYSLAFTLSTVFMHFTENNRTVIQLVLIFGFLFALPAVWNKRVDNFFRVGKFSPFVFLIPVISYYFAFATFNLPNLAFERQLAVENEYYFGNYEKAEELIKGTADPSDQMIFYYNLIQARRGKLPDHLFDMPRQILGTEIQLNENSSRGEFRVMPDFYYEVGDMVYAERAAMLCMVFTPKNTFTPMLKRLAEVNLVAADTLAAMKYLRILKQAPAYREWAERHTPGQMSPAVENDILRRRAFVNKTDTIRLGAASQGILEKLLDTNKGNIVALDYLLCSYMLARNREGFVNAFNKYEPRMTRLYEMGLR